MMNLEINQLVMAVLGGAIGLVVFLTIVSRWLHVRAERRALSHRVVCRLCLHVFEDHSHGKLVVCPMCHAVTEKGRNRQLG